MPRDPKKNRATEPSADPALDEMLRQIGADILDEPVPDRLLRALRPKTEAECEPARPNDADDPPEGARPPRDPS